GQVYDHEGDVHKPAVADILIEDDKILSVGANLASDDVHEVIDASGRLVVPGLINAHYHSHDVLCRGLFEELPLEIWLLYTLPHGRRPQQGRGARTYLGGRAGVPAVRHLHRPGHFLRSTTNRPTSSSPPIARQAFAWCSHRWSGIFLQSGWSATRTASRLPSRGCWGISRARSATSSITSSTSSNAIRRAGP